VKLYPEFQRYFRERKPPLLPTERFALGTHLEEIAAVMPVFLAKDIEERSND
jgi:hypothetical protein